MFKKNYISLVELGKLSIVFIKKECLSVYKAKSL